MAYQRVSVNGVTLRVADDGVGDAVLLLHGFPDTSELWREQIPALVETGYRVIAPDLRGFGESDKPQTVAAYDMPVILGDLRGLLDHFGVERAHVVGHDWGAVTAWAFAGWHPERTNRLVAISVGHPRAYTTTLSQLPRTGYALFFQVPRLAEATLSAKDFAALRAFLRSHPELHTYIERLGRPGALTASLNWYRANGKPHDLFRYPRVQVPAMGIWGSKDWALGERQMTRSKRYVDAPWRYERLEAGHWIPLTRAQILNRLLVDFLAG